MSNLENERDMWADIVRADREDRDHGRIDDDAIARVVRDGVVVSVVVVRDGRIVVRPAGGAS